MKMWVDNGKKGAREVNGLALALVSVLLLNHAVVILGQPPPDPAPDDPDDSTDDTNITTTTTTTTTTEPTTTLPATTTEAPFHPYPEERKIVNYGGRCIPDLVEILAMQDVITEAAAVRNVYINDINDWTEEWEVKYIQYLTKPSPFSAQRIRTEQTELAWDYGVCNYTHLLHCYHTGTIMNLQNANMTTLGTCLPDRFYAHDPDNPNWKFKVLSVNVGFPCEFDSGLAFHLTNNSYDCSETKKGGDPEPAKIDTSRSDVDFRLNSSSEVTRGIYFIGLGIRIPMRNHLIRHAKMVCKCPDSVVPNTKGGCVKPTSSSSQVEPAFSGRLVVLALLMFMIIKKICPM